MIAEKKGIIKKSIEGPLAVRSDEFTLGLEEPLVLSLDNQKDYQRKIPSNKLFPTKDTIDDVEIGILPKTELKRVLSKIKKAPTSQRRLITTKILEAKISDELTKPDELRSVENEVIVPQKGGIKVLKSGEKIDYSELSPLKDVMKIALTVVGATPPESLPLIAQEFYNKVVTQVTTGIGPADYKKDAEKIVIADKYDEDQNNVKNIIIDGITSFVRGAKMKSAAGKKLTKVERVIVEGVTAAERSAENEIKRSLAQRVGDKILFDRKTQIIILISITAIIILVKKVS